MHVVGIIGRANFVFGQIEHLVRVHLDIVGIYSAERGVDDLVHFRLVALVEDLGVRHLIHRASRLMKVYIAATAVICSVMEDDAHAAYRLLGHPLIAQVAFDALHATYFHAVFQIF